MSGMGITNILGVLMAPQTSDRLRSSRLCRHLRKPSKAIPEKKVKHEAEALEIVSSQGAVGMVIRSPLR